MGRYVGNVWHEELADPGGGGVQGNSVPTSVPAPSKPAAGGVATVPAPAAMPSTLGNTNDQSVRADLRKQAYFIDASGIYAPGAGDRVGDTFSGTQSGMNVAPSASRLPIINGVPISPSNGMTGPNTGAIMYRSDPQYASLFGQGTPGYTSTSMQANALPGQAVPGQTSLADWNTQQAATRAAPAPAVQDAGAVAPTITDPATQAAAAAAADPAAFQEGVSAPNESGTGYGPYATAEPPKLTSQGQYSENGKIIQKSVDQFGNPYYQTIGNAPTSVAPPAGAPAATPPAAGSPDQAAPPVPAHQDPAAVANPASVTPTGMSTHTFIGTDGKPQVVSLSEQDYQTALQDQQNAQAATREAAQFAQGIESGKLDVLRATQVAQQAYNTELVKSNSVQNAQTAMRDAMNNEIAKQTQQINAAAQAATAIFQQGQLEQQRSATAQQNAIEMQKLEAQRQSSAMANSTEQDKLSVQRQSSRGRRLPQVRYA